MIKMRIDLYEDSDPEKVARSLLVFCLDAVDLSHIKDEGTIARIPGKQLMTPGFDFLISYSDTDKQMLDRLVRDNILTQEDVDAIADEKELILKRHSMSLVTKGTKQ